MTGKVLDRLRSEAGEAANQQASKSVGSLSRVTSNSATAEFRLTLTPTAGKRPATASHGKKSAERQQQHSAAISRR